MMSAADLHDLELTWPSLLPTDVIVTGTFDQWSSSIRLVKADTGFFGTVKVPWGEKVAYKFIVDGHWRCREDRPQEDDGNGNINNVFRTPEKPQAVFVVTHDLPPHLSIPLERAQSEGHGDIEAMVTAVEFLPPTEPAAARGSLPFPIPQISIEGLGLTPSADTPVSVSKLDTAAATEGTVPPASNISAELVSFKQAQSSSNVFVLPAIDNGSTSLPPVNGGGDGHDLNRVTTHTPIEFTKPKLPASFSAPEAAQDSAVFQSSLSPQGAQDAPATSADHVDTPPTFTSAAVLDPTAKPVQGGLETPAQGHRQQETLPTPSPSTPASSTLTHKKRRSLFARVKHIFDKGNDKRERKEKNKH